MSYNKDTDYQEKINEAVKAGDYESAARYEQSRNEKIDGENLSYEKTNNYSGWLDTTDYSNIIRDQISSGKSRKSVSDTLKKRIEKASGTVGLSHYAYDDVYEDAVKYIMGESSFSYAEAPEFKNSYQDEIDDLYAQLASVEEFDYDLYSDDLYNYYKTQYNREGKRAMQDLLGQLSMNTGGVASSYAVSAAGQMLENYNTKLTDKIPELYESAYERYLDSVGSKRDNLEVLAELSETQYQRYLDEVEQYNKEREFEHQKYLDELDYDYLMKELSLEEDENNRNWLQQEYENGQKEKQEAIDTALKKWEEMGYLDSESARILGLPEGLHTSDYDYKKAQQYKLYNK